MSGIPGLIVAAPSSGSGKTTALCLLAAGLVRRGVAVRPFKAGPDYLDPTHHRAVTGRESRNLDGWMMGRDGVAMALARGSAGGALALIEGMMGLFDGRSPDSLDGSAAQLAQWLSARVILVIDASAMARSAAAVAEGFANHASGVVVAGVIFNRVGSAGHARLLRAALSHTRGPDGAPLRYLGAVPQDAALALPERHLGLVAARQATLSVDVLAEHAARHLDLDAVLALAQQTALPLPAVPGPLPPRVRIGVARDDAFHFYYADNLDLLREAGAQLVPFSPLADARLPEGLDGLIIGGGYPEAHAETLSANATMRADIAAFAASGRLVYAECGGLMYLGASLTVGAREHPMCGVLDHRTAMADRLVVLGYREVETTADSILGPAGTTFRGHEFHHSVLSSPPTAPTIYTWSGYGGSGREGYARGRVLASYIHAHWGGSPDIPRRLVAACGES
ncbi:MAG: cobyrinate a,c-diamide synthase [Myxococcota bacterium]|nr:cobyrinate a,c-diamide synthase [Myxococcota bacterium]